jgi:hypothetical protein
MPEAE